MPQTITTTRTDAPPSETVVLAVAEAKGVDPTALDDRLYDIVDPDALDRLFHTTSGTTAEGAAIVFRMAGCRVEVDADGRVTAELLDDQPRAPVAATR